MKKISLFINPKKMNQVTYCIIAAITMFLLAVGVLFSKVDLEKFLPNWIVISFILLLFGSCLMNIITAYRHFKNDNEK